MFVRQMMYLVAVARERHFARAAATCNVSQPTLSAGIRKLEEELGMPLVLRGHRFLGLTPEGERVLAWARQIIADYENLRQDLAGSDNTLFGTLRLGIIPAALPALPHLLTPFCARHPALTAQVQTVTSIAIQRGLDEFEIDAGVTYLDNEPLKRIRCVELYQEHYMLITRSGTHLQGRNEISWADAATEPLCLLSRDMQNRRIIDHIFHEIGVDPEPQVESNSFTGILSLVQNGPWSSIVPHTYAESLGAGALHALQLVEPIQTHAVGLVFSEREPLSPVAAALLRCVRELHLENGIKRELAHTDDVTDAP